jgi:hypothetical protein
MAVRSSHDTISHDARSRDHELGGMVGTSADGNFDADARCSGDGGRGVSGLQSNEEEDSLPALSDAMPMRARSRSATL